MVWAKHLSTNQRSFRMQAAQSPIQLPIIWISTLGELNNPVGTTDWCSILEGVCSSRNPEVCGRCGFWGVCFVGFFGWFVFFAVVCLFLLACFFSRCIKKLCFFLTNPEGKLQLSLFPKLEPNLAASKEFSQILYSNFQSSFFTVRTLSVLYNILGFF